MSDAIVNGELDRGEEFLAHLGLRMNPFSKLAPPPERLNELFVGREAEIKKAARAVADRRKVLVLGGYGAGKTTFTKKLMYELEASSGRRQFVTGYATLSEASPHGFHLACLAALCRAILQRREVAIAASDEAERARQEIAAIQGLPRGQIELRFQDLLTKARTSESDRFVLVIDELDKADSEVVRNVLAGARPILDLPDVAFVVTARPFDLFGDGASIVNAPFEERIVLGSFSAEASREIIQRNLELARLAGKSCSTFEPFTEDLVDVLVTESRGLPRSLNMLSSNALERALRESIDQPPSTWCTTVTPEHLERALAAEGADVYATVDRPARATLLKVFSSGGNLALTEAKERGIEADSLEALARRDTLLSLTSRGETTFFVSPQIERRLKQLEAVRDKLGTLWRAALAAESNGDKGKTLEDFAVEFFQQQFKIVRRDARTDTSELDLVMEPVDGTDPRFRSMYVIAECKNWRSEKVGQPEISKLAGDLKPRGVRNAFVLTTGDITADARLQARHWFSELEIVLIDGHAIERFLSGEVGEVADLLIDEHMKACLRLR